MDKRATIALATVVGVTALGGFYWLGTKNTSTPVPVYPSATATAPVGQAPLDAPAKVAVVPATAVVSVPNGVAVAPNPAGGTAPTTVVAPRDTVALLPPQTPVLDKTVATTTQTTQVVPAGQPEQVAYVGPSGRPSLITPPVAPVNEVDTVQTKQVNGTQTTTTSTRTVHTASTHKTVHTHKHQKPGNIHVARATKHTVMFAAKLPFRLRP